MGQVSLQAAGATAVQRVECRIVLQHSDAQRRKFPFPGLQALGLGSLEQCLEAALSGAANFGAPQAQLRDLMLGRKPRKGIDQIAGLSCWIR